MNSSSVGVRDPAGRPDALRSAALRGGVAALALLLIGCAGSAPETACPEIALLRGFSVVVDPDSVPGDPPERVLVKVCQEGTCRSANIDLLPGTDAVDRGCAGTEPEAACSAEAVPNGTLVGNWTTGDFEAGPLTAKVSGRGFGPFTADLEGTEVTAGSGVCSQTAFQTTLHVSNGTLAAAVPVPG